MPLLKRREFKPLKPPDDLDPDEEVFVCRLTNEVFRKYDDFFKRTILCNSLVWSCSLTSRPGLTYQEALESEDRARKLLASFPVYLEAPILFLVTLTRRGRLADICDDVFVFARDRYFIGEIVDVSYRGNRETCRVERVIPPGDYGKQLLAEESPPSTTKSESNEVMIVGENGEVTEVVIVQEEKAVPKTPKMWKPKTLQPSGYKYEVLSLQGSGRYKVSADKVSRKKGLYTRDKNKLYLKQNCQIIDMQWNVKPEVANKYNIKNKKFSDFFAGPIPNFASTPSKRNRSDGGKKFEDEDDLPLTEVKKKEAKLKKKEKSKEKTKKGKSQSPDDKAKKVRLTPEEREAMKQKLRDMRLQEKQRRIEEKVKERDIVRQKKQEEKAAKKEEVRRAAEEDKEKRKKEREHLRLEKQKLEEFLKEWNKPREDLECDDLKDLPKPNPVKCKIPQKLFGDALMLMEFLFSFGDQLSVQEEFPEGITLETIEEALFSHQVDGALYDLLKLLLSSIFHLQDEEEEDEKVDLKEHAGDTSLGDLAEILNEDDPTYAALSNAASSALIWSQIHQGTPLRNLPLESTTISEVLRLHLLASGAETSAMDARWRYQQRGAYTFHDDPGLELRLKEPAILKALTNGNVYDLNADSRMMIINTLCNQILSYVTIRDIIEESWDQWQVTKKEWKEICRLEKLREKEEVTIKYKRKLEERARTQFKVMEEHRKAQEKAEEEKKTAEMQGGEGDIDLPDLNGDLKDESPGGSRNTAKPPELLLEELGKELSPEEKEKRRLKEEAESAVKKEEFLQKKEEHEKNLTEFSTRYSVTPVGLDRIFRRYWIFQAVPGVFVEFDKELMDGMDSLVLMKETGAETSQEDGADEVKDDQDSSGVSEDSNKENKGVVEVNGEPSQKDVKDGVLSSQETEENNLNSDKMQTEQEVVDVKQEEEVEAMEVSGDKEENSIKEEEAETKEERREGDQGNVKEELMNGKVEHEDAKGTSDGDEDMKEIPQSPVKQENLPASEEDATNQDIVPWAYYHKSEELDALLGSLNSRGFRERALKLHLGQQKGKIAQNFEAFPENYLAGIRVDGDGVPWSAQKAPSTPRQVVIKMTSGKKGLVSNQADGDETLELLLREAILDLEDRVWQGGLGIIKVKDRVSWIAAIEQGSYDRQCNEISWGPLWARSLMDDSDFLDMSISEPSLLEHSKKSAALKMKDRISELKRSETPTGSPSSTRCSTPTVTDNVVRDMACALLQICQGLHDKYLIKPLGIHEEVKRPGPRARKIVEKEEEEADKEKDEAEEKKHKKTCRECWEESLMASSSLSQVFLHLSTLEQSILWSKSILNARCRICRRKGDAEAMLLCDYCDRGHHMYCLKPPLKNVPKGDWFCKDCTPKAVKRAPRKTRRKTFDEEAEEKVEEEEDEEEDDDDSDSDDSSEEEEDEEDDDGEEEEDEDEEEEEDGEEEDDEEGEEEDDEEDEEEEQEEEEEEEVKAPAVKLEVRRGRAKAKPSPVSTKAKGNKSTAAAVKEKVVAPRGRRGGGGRRKEVEEKDAPADDVESSEDDLNESTILTSKEAYYTCYICRHGGQLLRCIGCEGAVHLGCLDPGQLKKGQQWCCDTCSKAEPQEGEAADTSQHGAICVECGHGGKLIFCSTCSSSLHLGCCRPPLTRLPRKDWQCNECKENHQEGVVAGKAGRQARGKAQTNKPPERGSRHSRRKTQESDSDVHTVQVDEEITLNISDDGTKLKKSLREARQDSQRPIRGKKRTRSAEEDADTEEEEEARAVPSRKKSLTVVLTRQDKELRKLVSIDGSPETTSSNRRRSSTTGRGSSDMHQLGQCEQLLKELVRHADAGPFMVPVSKKTVPDYYRVIKRPMDFSTMQSKVTTMQYATPVEFIADLRLIFTNCQQYNRYQSYEAKKGRKVWAFLEQRVEELGLQTEVAVNKRKDLSPSPSGDTEDRRSSGERKRARRKKVITDV